MQKDSSLTKLFREKKSFAEHQWGIIKENVRDAELYFHNLKSGRNKPNGGIPMTPNVSLSWTARLLESSPTVKGFPSKVTAIPKVKVANEVYKYVARDQEFDSSDFDTVLRGLKQGTSAQFFYWDAERGDDLVAPQRDEMGDFILDDEDNPTTEVVGKYGSVAAREFGATEFCYGPGNKVENAHWFLVKLVMSEDELRDYLVDTKADLEEVMSNIASEDVPEFLGVNGESERKYVILDFWALPGEGRRAGGRGIYTGGGTKIKEVEWPLPFRMLPFCVFHVRPIDGNPFGTSPLWDIIPIQKEYDRHEKLKVEVMKMQRVYQLVHHNISSALDSAKHGRVVVPSIGGVQGGITYSKPPEVPSAVMQRSQELLNQAYDTIGLNESLVGSESAGSNWSAKLISYLNRMDSQKQKGAYLSWVSFLRRRARIIAKLYQTHAVATRVIAIMGEAGTWEALEFKGSDLQDVDFHFEEVPGSELLSSVEAAEAKDDMQAGRISLDEGMERAETGLGETLGDHGNLRDVRSYIDAAMQSAGNVEPPPGMNPQEIIRQAELKMNAPDANVSALKEIITKARAAVAQQQQAAQEQNAQG